MKFDRLSCKGFFYELLSSHDATLFDKAFERREILLPPADETEAKLIKAGVRKPRTRVVVDHRARKWVESVISMFADQMHIQPSLAIQAVKTGDADAIVRHYTRRWYDGRLAALRSHPDHAFVERMLKPKADEPTQYDQETGEPIKKKLASIDQGPLNYMRDRWSWCLTLSVPNN